MLIVTKEMHFLGLIKVEYLRILAEMTILAAETPLSVLEAL